ncbi:helix-turn-helix domain-containing protein [Microbacterium sp. cx-59]|uniref:helix-turn-helix domain-containing protein n=1 Tax=Microbacterium sp. cx-59 TaxID=2891207 RepID=UPI001E5F489C|nr:helix-turn-helix domain-containing protein [Microbacterium sp. cx-59]MCC4907765.1 helix-turn-helix domain-containing protein [Microbacterium sp. cx-59]
MATGNASGAAPSPRSPHQLTLSQAAVLSWIVEGCPDGVYPEDSFAHRISARALVSRGLVKVSGHGHSWQAVPTESGRVWPGLTDSDAAALERANQQVGAVEGRPSPAKSAATVSQYLQRRPAPAKPSPITYINKQETYMRFKVMVTRVQVAERWIRGVDEEDAARKVREEFEKPYAYFGHWETKASEIEIVEVEQTTVIPPNLLDESGPMLLTVKDAAQALGIPHRGLGELASRGDIEFTRVGSRKYIPRESLLAFVRENTHRGDT